MDVRAAFVRHLSLPEAPLNDTSGIALQLHRWKNRTLREVLEVLLQFSVGHHVGVGVGPVLDTGASVDDTKGALIAADPLLSKSTLGFDPIHHLVPPVGRLLRFDPVD